MICGAFIMDWEARWEKLANVITDLRRKGEVVPFHVINDLRSAKTILEILKIDREHPENVSRLEEYLGNVEAYVFSVAERKLGKKYVDSLLERFCEEEGKPAEAKTQMRFHPDLPREERWIRIQATDEAPIEVIRKIAGECNLKCRAEEDGYALVYGRDDEIKIFVRRIAEIFSRKRDN